jgi:hypothetical protein
MPETTSAVALIALNLTNLITSPSRIQNPVRAAKRRRILSGSVSGQNVNCNAGDCISSPKTGGESLDSRFKRQKLVPAFMYLSYEREHQSSICQFARSGSRLRSPAYTRPSFHCEGVLLSALLEPEVTPACAAGTEDSRKERATWQSASH